MKKFYPMLSVFFILVLLLLGSSIFKLSQKMEQKQQTLKQSTSTLTVYQSIQPIPTSASKFDKIDVKKGTTALDLLKKTTKLETKGEGKDAFVTSINGKKANDEKHEFWAFYVNGKQAQVGAGSYILQNNDKITWKIENY